MNNIAKDISSAGGKLIPPEGHLLMERLWSKEITMEEFDRETAYLILKNDISSLSFAGVPVEKPDNLKKYSERKARDEGYNVSDDFWQRPEIREYFAGVSRAKSHNEGNKHWLLFCLKHLPSEDTLNRDRVKKVLHTHIFSDKPEWDRKDLE